MKFFASSDTLPPSPPGVSFDTLADIGGPLSRAFGTHAEARDGGQGSRLEPHRRALHE